MFKYPPHNTVRYLRCAKAEAGSVSSWQLNVVEPFEANISPRTRRRQETVYGDSYNNLKGGMICCCSVLDLFSLTSLTSRKKNNKKTKRFVVSVRLIKRFNVKGKGLRVAVNPINSECTLILFKCSLDYLWS